MNNVDLKEQGKNMTQGRRKCRKEINWIRRKMQGERRRRIRSEETKGLENTRVKEEKKFGSSEDGDKRNKQTVWGERKGLKAT